MPVVFNYRPRPVPGESFRGYLLRLTSLNGYSSVSGVLALTGHSYSLETGAPWIRSSQTLMAALEPALHIASGELVKHFELPDITQGLNDGQRRRIYRRRAALCPLCLKTDGYIRTLADVALLPVCPIHHVAMIESCSGCGEAIDFNRDELDHCPHCERPYTHDEPNSLPPSDPAAYLCRQLYRGKVSLVDVLSACDRMSRPLDILPGAPAYADNSLRWMHEHLKYAAALLYSPDFRSGYRDELVAELADASMVHAQAPTLPLDRFTKTTRIHVSTLLSPTAFSRIEHFQRFATKTENPVEDAKTLGVAASRLRCWNRDVHQVDLSRQISAELLSDYVGISQRDLLALNTSGVLRPVNGVRTARHQLFDLNAVLDLLRAIPTGTPTGSETCTASEIRNDLKLFAADYSVLISLILAGEIPAANNRVAFASMQFDRNQARLALHRHLLANNEINGNALAGVMATSNKQLLQLRTQWKNSASGDMQLGALTAWVSLNRVAKLAGTRLLPLRKALASQGIEPSYVIPGTPQVLYVYSLTQEFRSAINSTLQGNRYSGF